MPGIPELVTLFVLIAIIFAIGYVILKLFHNLNSLQTQAKKQSHLAKSDFTSFDQVTRVKITNDKLAVQLVDGRVILTPLHWFDWLERATSIERNNYEITGISIVWPQLRHSLDVTLLLSGEYRP